jgi:hypothetical protein
VEQQAAGFISTPEISFSLPSVIGVCSQFCRMVVLALPAFRRTADSGNLPSLASYIKWSTKSYGLP